MGRCCLSIFAIDNRVGDYQCQICSVKCLPNLQRNHFPNAITLPKSNQLGEMRPRDNTSRTSVQYVARLFLPEMTPSYLVTKNNGDICDLSVWLLFSSFLPRSSSVD